MYKVFFKDRVVFFLNKFSDANNLDSGLIYKYGDRNELKALIMAYFDLKTISRLYISHEDTDFIWNEFTSCFRIIKAAGGVVTNTEKQILIIKRHGLWDLPKGKAEPGENTQQTALREVSEECSLDGLEIGKLITTTWHTYILDEKPVLKETSWFEMYTSDGNAPTPQLKEDITEAVWFRRENVASISNNTYPSIVEVLKSKGLF